LVLITTSGRFDDVKDCENPEIEYRKANRKKQRYFGLEGMMFGQVRFRKKQSFLFKQKALPD
jgi:hypothetical protein